MALINSIEQVRTVLRITSLDQDSSLPDMEAAQEEHLLPCLGEEFLEHLEENIQSNNEVLSKVIKRAQKVLAHFAYLDDLPIIHSRLTDAGIKKIGSEDMPAVRLWEYKEVAENLSEKGYQALESLLVYLEKNVEDEELASWVESDEYKARTKFLIRSGKQFSECYNLFQPYRTYHLLQPCLVDVEAFYIHPSIGEEFYNSLKELIEPDESNKAVIDLLKRAEANLAIAQACDKLVVRITDKGLTIMKGTAESNDSDRAAANTTAITVLKNKVTTDGNAYLHKARKLLNELASEEVFALYFNSIHYQPTSAKPYDRGNRCRKIFAF